MHKFMYIVINYLFTPYTIDSWWIQPIPGSLRPYITMIVFPFLTFNSLGIIWRYLTRHWRTYPDIFVLGLLCVCVFFCVVFCLLLHQIPKIRNFAFFCFLVQIDWALIQAHTHTDKHIDKCIHTNINER